MLVLPTVKLANTKATDLSHVTLGHKPRQIMVVNCRGREGGKEIQ